MAGGKTRVRPTSYRDAQNVIRDSRNKAIVYLPPEAKDVAPLMQQLVAWISATNQPPVPLRAAIAHYQYAAVHPYYDGNGRTARLLTTLILHPGGYGLKGLYALDEYYARDLKGYYEALTLGPSHNYYMGRVEADITPWVAYSSKAWPLRSSGYCSRRNWRPSRAGRINRPCFATSMPGRERCWYSSRDPGR